MRKTRIAAVLAAALVSGAVLAQPADQVPTTQPLNELTLVEQLTMLEQAVDGIERLVKRNEMERAGELLVQASQAVRQVLQNAPLNIQARVLAGDLAMLSGELDIARQRYLDVLTSDEFNFRANLGIGRYYVRSRIWRQAAAYLEKALRVAPPDRRSEVLRLLAQAYNGQGLRRRAIDTARQAVAAENPPTFEALELLVQLNLDGQQFEDAVATARSMREAAERDRSQSPGDIFLLNRLVAATELEAKAVEQLYRSMHKRNARGQYSDDLLEGKEAEAASALYQWAVTHDRLSDLKREQKAHEQAIALEQALAYEPNNSRYLLGYGGVLIQARRYPEAVEILQRLLELDVADATDADPGSVRENQATAREYLGRLGVEVGAAQQGSNE